MAGKADPGPDAKRRQWPGYPLVTLALGALLLRGVRLDARVAGGVMLRLQASQC